MSTVPTTSSGSYSKRLVLLIWLLVGFFYFFLSWGYIRTTMDDQRFSEYLQYVVQIGGSEERSAKEIRALLLVKADQLNLPVRGDQIAITGSGSTLNVRVNYTVDIEIPVVQSIVYTKEIDHFAKYQIPNR